ncbi:dihydrofolate synthase/folylpolyglutamate synthase [Winogradskyella wandonensis]|uniref:Dihydrofolate synthase/folylpolyglutamate synthase n=1 Tax=Winogradskyella wandonensis TaxID=1442586 RepID=A0A4R1KUZ1_9FLAO|nr:folylpolyglutamate synthase/dihydrofolate synthase family protein [Winogradskyella wandonensis]TCK68503.1 dihydrofolate synthase/folylpolyglutamate synthase [Winogradskyella wandonensis]
MNYKETVDWLFLQLPMYQRQGKTAYKKDLSNTIVLSNYLNNPEKKFKSIHVGGTNGKGSCSHMLASIFQEAGYKVGLYTSPHLKDYRERIKINGKEISEEFVVQFVEKHKSFLEANTLSFFEMTVGLAFDYFSKSKVDIAIIEVGLGGRLDSTNIITPELSVITNIGFDHVQFLGDTRPKIAGEKAGIIKPNTPVVIGETHAETRPVFTEKAKACNSPIYFADTSISEVYPSDLKGAYQIHNIKTVMKSIDVLRTIGYSISENQIKVGLLSVVKNTSLMGRWQVLGDNPKIICDTAHNTEGLSYVMKQLQAETYKRLRIVFGVVNDKNLDEIMPLLPKEASYYLARPDIPRGLDADELSKVFDTWKLKNKVYSSVDDAYKAAKLNTNADDVLYVGGSTFVVAEIL